jgi:hypothetical protein
MKLKPDFSLQPPRPKAHAPNPNAASGGWGMKGSRFFLQAAEPAAGRGGDGDGCDISQLVAIAVAMATVAT